ncbi:ABC transporter transmembrane domain-containing protein [Oceanotoga sp. DSM 15011]|uniref:ABC transporter transmembrane domain-containing protein n=1 Tax=Oceanotoga sp. DSM 15011 TaxID=2984951 RepID=UPI0021F4E3EE|nr:ABC transporter transmembrane domain-containing protein [Oceanotoga sp. DSM 15011]UYO98808.1 ABC transporter transmembrane domain-containing protein [Oceanotoga sp. DSM 15011]
MNSLKIFFKNNYFNTIIVLILSLITGFFSFILSEKLKIFFNTGIMNNDVQTIQNNIFIIFFLFIFMFIFNISSSVLENLIMWRGSKNLNIYSLNNIFKTDYDYFLNKPAPSIWTNLNISSSKVSSFYTSIIFMVSRLIEMIIYLYIIFKISFYAGLFSLIAIPLTLLFTIGIKKKMADYQMKMLEKSRELSSSTIESLDSIKNIKVKNAYDYFLNKIEKRI